MITENLTYDEWYLLSCFDDAILARDYKNWNEFVNSITLEEKVAIIKWLNRSGNRYYTLDSWDNLKETIIKEYVYFQVVDDLENVSNDVDVLSIIWNEIIDYMH